MKNILYLWLIVSIFSSPLTLKAEEANKVEITYLSGNVEAQLKDTEEYTAAEEGMQLEAGDKIKTSNIGSTEISFNEDDSNFVRLSENTVAEILLQENEKIDVSEGEIFTSISNLPIGSAFEIRTPTAVSGARGTDWVTKVTSEGTDVEAIDRMSYVKHFQGEGTLSPEMTLIQSGQMTSVRKFERPMAPRPMANTRREKFQAIKQDIKLHAKEAVIKRQQRQPFNREQFKEKIKNLRQNKQGAAFKPLVSREDGVLPTEQKVFSGESRDGKNEGKSLISGKEDAPLAATGGKTGSSEQDKMIRRQKVQELLKEYKEQKDLQDKDAQNNKPLQQKENNQQKPDNKNNKQANNQKREINRQADNNKTGIGRPGGGPPRGR